MIKVEKMSFSFPDKDLYNKISFSIEEGEHCAFIGTNGTGKSTLVDMLMHTEDYLYDGKIEKISNCTFGYVSQFVSLTEENVTVFDYLSGDFISKQNRINELCDLMATAENLDDIFEEYQIAFDEFQAMDGDNYESNIRKQLKVANLTQLENLMMSQISGGELKLIQVIKAMLVTPKLLIMDEPDVFLDFYNINALCDLINQYKGTVLVITHNRYLLQNCFNKIIHLEDKLIQEYEGTYTDYNLELLKKKVELQEQAIIDQEEIERNQEIVNKLRDEATYIDSVTRGKALHARVSYLERLQARRTVDPFVEGKNIEIDFHTEKTVAENNIVSVNGLEIGFDNILLENVCFDIGKTDKVAVVGPNGTGKTTLLRKLYKALEEQNECVTFAENTEIAYLSQLQNETLEEQKSILSVFDGMGFENELEIREYLKGYGFEEDGFKRRASELSGGEKNLIQLAKIALGDANLLLLDEPTSHLDIYSQQALETAVKNYNGAVIMVSHDFYTIVNSMDYVLWVEEKEIRKVSIRKFRKMIYENHFSLEYIEREQKKKELEQNVINALRDKDIKKAKKLAEKL